MRGIFASFAVAAAHKSAVGCAHAMEFFSREPVDRAEHLGMTVVMVERDLPRGDSRRVVLERGTCARYSLPRTGPAPRVTWSLLQRSTRDGAQLPNGYLLETVRALPEGLSPVLHRIAQTYDEDLFEFEGTESEVAVFWMESGGVDQVDELYEVLSELARY